MIVRRDFDGGRAEDKLLFRLIAGAADSLDVADDLAVCKLDDAVCIGLGILAVMRDNDDELFCREAFECIEHLSAGIGIQSAGRLVGHDNLRILDERTRDCDTLLLAAGELIRVAAAVPCEIDVIEDAVDLLIRCRPVLQLQRQCDIRADGEFLEDIVLLENEADVGIAVAVEALLGEILGGDALDDDLAAVIGIEAAEQVEHCGFAAAGFAEQEDHALFRKAQ